MKVSEMVLYLEKYDDDADVFIQTEEGTLHKFRIEHRESVFDGFDEFYKEGINLKIID